MRFVGPALIGLWLLVGGQAAFAEAALNSAIPVLVYHQISTPDRSLAPKSDVIELSQFSEQMEYLHRNGYETISTRQLIDFMLEGSPLPKKAFVLHFDDGWKSVEAALPILERYDFKAAFWIIAEKGIGGDYLDWNEIILLSRNPRYEVYSHTMTHPWDPKNNLVNWQEGKVPGKSLADVDWELRESKRVLEERLGQPVPFLAWPIGAYNQTLIAMAVRAGYSALFTIDWGANGSPGNVLRVRRNYVSGFLCDIDDFRAVLEDGHYRLCEQRNCSATKRAPAEADATHISEYRFLYWHSYSQRL